MGWLCLIITFWIFGEMMSKVLKEIRDELKRFSLAISNLNRGKE